MPNPFLRRRAMLTALGASPIVLAACAPDDQGFKSEDATATDGAIAVDDLTDGGTTLVDFGSTYVALVRDGNEVTGMSGYCTHQQCAVNDEHDGTLHCPCHGSVFDAATGEVEHGPADKPLPAVAVTVKDGMVTLA